MGSATVLLGVLSSVRARLVVYCATCVISNGSGFCAACGCSGPAYTLSLRQRLTAERVLREHAADGLLDGPLGVLLEQLDVADGLEAAGVAGVAVGLLLLALRAGQRHLAGVDDDDEVTGVDVRRERRLVLAPQQDGDLAGQAAEHDVGRVDDVPAARRRRRASGCTYARFVSLVLVWDRMLTEVTSSLWWRWTPPTARPDRRAPHGRTTTRQITRWPRGGSKRGTPRDAAVELRAVPCRARDESRLIDAGAVVRPTSGILDAGTTLGSRDDQSAHLRRRRGPAAPHDPSARAHDDYDLLVIGSGPGGQKAAIAAAKLGQRVAVVERADMVGGVCINTGTIPSKTLREAVLYLTGLNQRELYGAELPGQGGHHRRRTCSSRTQHVIGREIEVIRSQLHRNDVDLLAGHRPVRRPAHASPSRGDAAASGTVTADAHRHRDRHHAGPPGQRRVRRAAASSTPTASSRSTGIPRSHGRRRRRRHRHRVRVDVRRARQPRSPSSSSATGCSTSATTRSSRRSSSTCATSSVTFRFGEKVASVEAGRARHGHDAGQRQADPGRHGDVLGRPPGRDRASSTSPPPGSRPTTAGASRSTSTTGRRSPHIYAVGDVIGFPALAATSMEQGRLAAYHAFDEPVNSPASSCSRSGSTRSRRSATAGRPRTSSPASSVPYEVGISRYRELARGQIVGDTLRHAQAAGLHRHPHACSASTCSAPARPSWSTSARR